ncbi:putative acyl-CoA transferases/carnitine dehydratase [Phaeosphaeriaceae sp. PMI808]|nr:putative acyl-CoA transferases/carnitine dehydratase [Phaeosphaeriaceae sp. PMI808]
MAINSTSTLLKDGYSAGTCVDTTFVPVPEECRRLLRVFAAKTPGFTRDDALLDGVVFEAIAAALHAMFGIVGLEIMNRRNNTTRTSPAIIELPKVSQWDPDRKSDSPLVFRATAIYETAGEGTWFQLHGSLDPWKMLRFIAIAKDAEAEARSTNEAHALIQKHVRNYRAWEIEQLILEHGPSGSIVHSPESWRKTEMGQSLSRHPLVHYAQQTYCPDTPPTPLPKLNDRRPLERIKVVELARIIAGTAVGAAPASMRAEVIRMNSSKLKDYTPAQPSSLMADLDNPANHAKRGFGLQAALQMANKRSKGIIYVDEDCYGPDGCYAEPGSSYVMGQSFGCPPDQGVLPSLPISDTSTGLLAALTIMCAIRDRSTIGGSYHGHAALTEYDMATLDPNVRLYQQEAVQRIQDNDAHILKAWESNGDSMKNEEFFMRFSDSVFVARYADKESSPRWASSPVPFCHHDFKHFSDIR